MSKTFTILFLLVTAAVCVPLKFIWRSKTIEVITINEATTDPDYSYDGKLAPKYWPKLFKTCGGHHQSPVRLNSGTAARTRLPGLMFKDFNQRIKSSVITNTGHTGC
jgi:carbonic anhydrase